MAATYWPGRQFKGLSKLRNRGTLLVLWVLLNHPISAMPDWIPCSISFHLTRDSIQKIWTFTLPPVRFSTSFAHHWFCWPYHACCTTGAAYFNVMGLNVSAARQVAGSTKATNNRHTPTATGQHIFFIFALLCERLD